MSLKKQSDVAPAPFLRPVGVECLSAGRPFPVDITPSDDQKAKIVEFLGLASLDEMRLKGEITSSGRDRWRLTGRLTARLSQQCVVSLVPVAERIDEKITRDFIPLSEVEEADTLDLDPDREDDPDPFETSIDPGAVAVECLALALDPYPRSHDAEVAVASVTAPGIAPLRDEDLKPFAGLAALKDKMGRGD